MKLLHKIKRKIEINELKAIAKLAERWRKASRYGCYGRKSIDEVYNIRESYKSIKLLASYLQSKGIL